MLSFLNQICVALSSADRTSFICTICCKNKQGGMKVKLRLAQIVGVYIEFRGGDFCQQICHASEVGCVRKDFCRRQHRRKHGTIAGNIAGNTPTSPETGNIAGNIAGDVAGDIGGNITVAAMLPQCRRSVAGNVAGNFFCRTGVAPAIF